jgi:hypothetical protein
MNLPKDYTTLNGKQRRLVREEYVRQQDGKCWFCKQSLDGPPPRYVEVAYIRWELFPEGFLLHPVHLQHDHKTGMTEGAVHALCNAYLWEHHGR